MGLSKACSVQLHSLPVFFFFFLGMTAGFPIWTLSDVYLPWGLKKLFTSYTAGGRVCEGLRYSFFSLFLPETTGKGFSFRLLLNHVGLEVKETFGAAERARACERLLARRMVSFAKVCEKLSLSLSFSCCLLSICRFQNPPGCSP